MCTRVFFSMKVLCVARAELWHLAYGSVSNHATEAVMGCTGRHQLRYVADLWMPFNNHCYGQGYVITIVTPAADPLDPFFCFVTSRQSKKSRPGRVSTDLFGHKLTQLMWVGYVRPAGIDAVAILGRPATQSTVLPVHRGYGIATAIRCYTTPFPAIPTAVPISNPIARCRFGLAKGLELPPRFWRQTTYSRYKVGSFFTVVCLCGTLVGLQSRFGDKLLGI